MIVVDSSVWIDCLNGRDLPHVRRLREILGSAEVIIGDLMLCEVLQGLASEQAARDVETLLRRFALRDHRPVDRHLVHRTRQAAASQ